MANASHDGNRVTSLLAVSSSDGVTPVPLWADPITHRLLVDNANTGTSIGSTVTGGTNNSVLFINPSATLAQDNTNFVYTTAGGLRIGPTSAAITSENKLAVIGNANDYHGTLVQNVNAGTTASTDMVVTNDLGVADLTTYADFGVNSSGNTNAAMTGFKGSDVYLFTSGQLKAINIATGSTQPVRFFYNGYLIANEVAETNANGFTVGLTGTTLGKIVFAGNTSTGITLQGQAVGNSAVLTLPSTTGTLALTSQLTSGTVTSVSVVTANGISGSVATATTTPAITLTLGAITPTTVNGNTFTTGSSTYTGTAGQTYTFPSTTASIARSDAAQTFTGTQTFSQTILTANAITATANAATIPVTSGRNIVTNSSASGLTITLTTASAVNMQTCIVQILDFSAVAQTLTLVNTENSTVIAPANTNGSTTLPLTLGFIFNSATTKWRLVASS